MWFFLLIVAAIIVWAIVRKSREEQKGWVRDDPSNDLRKRATAEKKRGDIEAAIATLREAYEIMDPHRDRYGIDPFLRLPMYLQAAGRTDEAMDELWHLIETYDTGGGVDLYMQSSVYDKMRLVLQRAGRADEAVKYGVFSHLFWARALIKQDRWHELGPWMEHPERDIIVVEDLLKKAKRTEATEELLPVIHWAFEHVQTVRLEELGSRIDEVLGVHSPP